MAKKVIIITKYLDFANGFFKKISYGAFELVKY